LAAPATEVQKLLRHVSSVLRPHQMMVHCIDGFFPADPAAGQPARLISQLIRKETSITLIGALAGPALPEDVEEWCPAALVCGSPVEAIATATRQVLACPSLRIYTGADLIGVEVARAMCTVVSFASGICDVLEFGIATRATLVSRSAAEIARMGTALGGNERTFVGLAGVGGLMVASLRRESADFRLGRLIGAGIAVGEAVKQVGQTCDSVNMIRDAYGVTQAFGLKAPILATLHRMVFGNIEIAKALRELLDNPNYTE
jgi:glycerol-3-phosphate dehydrogenase (NAD(P)+)